jgi:4-amino-4-deoxy-L-arabinose transferase-like glycosyltransferase
VEISANYPPIFPAIGAAVTTLIGRFDDAYLRLASPILFVGLLLILFGWVRKERGSGTAWLAVILALGCPLLVMYAAWPTSYMLLSALTLTVLLLAYLAATHGKATLWLMAGIVAGLAMLTHFYGWLVLAFGLTAVLLWQRSRKGALQLALFVGVAFLVASPWLIRNLIRLHDPVYPLGSPIFHGIGLSQPLWGAAQAEIRQNALGQFGGANVPDLRVYELLAALFSRHFLAIGLLAPLLFGAWRALKKDLLPGYLGLAGLVLLLIQLAPGWYWLRSLVPALAIAAFLGAMAIQSMMNSVRQISVRFRPIGQLALVATGVAAIGLSSAVGGLLAFAGPNQDTWTTGMTGSHDMLTAVRNLGSDRKQLWTVYGGDYLCWQWLNTHLAPGERVATLDLRLYYFNRPQDLFYLDGQEAAPLLRMQDESSIADYLHSAGVKYIMIPAWAVAPTPARHPAVDLLPVMGMLGREGGFPLVAAFAGAGSNVPTTVYAVDLLQTPTVVPAVFAGSSAEIPNPSDTSFRFPRGATDPRIYAPSADTGISYLEFSYDNRASGRFDINTYDYKTKRWRLLYREERTGAGGPIDVSVRLPRSPSGWVDLGVYAAGSDLSITDLRVSTESEP